MPAHWSIEDGQTIPLTQFTGDDHPHPSAIAFSTGLDAHDMQLTLRCEDGSSYALTFNRNGVPQGPAVKTEAPAVAAAKAEKAEMAHTSESSTRRK